MSEGLPKELQNNVKYSNYIEDQLSLDESESDLRDIETLSGLGGEIKIGDVLIPPPTIGVLLMLEAIDSPFLSEEVTEISLDDVIRALYIMVERENAVTPLMLEKQAHIKAKQSFERTDMTPEHLSVYLSYLDSNKRYIDTFESAVKEFSMAIGAFNPSEAIIKIGEYISACMGGFKMIKSDTITKKKS